MPLRLAFIFALATCSWAQIKVDIHPVSGQASDRLEETERHWGTAQHLSWRAAKSEEELAVVKAITAIYNDHFQPQITSQPPIATLTEKGDDILVARWTFSASTSSFSELIVWDTPANTSFIFRLPPHSWSNNAAIQSSFERLLLPPRSDGRTPPAQGVKLNLARDARTRQSIGAGGLLVNYGPRQFDLGFLSWIDLWETTAASYLSAGFSRHVTRFPPNMRSIAERFPPLQTRAAQWSKQRILDALAPGSSLERDRVLARELVKRDMAGEELLEVLQSRLRHENGALLQAVVAAQQVPRFEDAIRKYLRADHSGNTKLLNPGAFRIVDQVQDVNFTDVAFEVLHEDPHAYGAFIYATDHGTTAGDYRALKDIPRPLRDARDWALGRMRERLGLDEAGNSTHVK